MLSSLCGWLPSMRWLLCGDDGSKQTKTTSVITKKNHAREFIHLQFYIKWKKLKTALNYSRYSFKLIRKQLNLHHTFLYIFPPRWYSGVASLLARQRSCPCTVAVKSAVPSG